MIERSELLRRIRRALKRSRVVAIDEAQHRPDLFPVLRVRAKRA
jgi:hypothetical protein